MSLLISFSTLLVVIISLIGSTLTAPSTTHENIKATTLEEVQSNLEDKDVLDLENLKHHPAQTHSDVSAGDTTLPTLEQQLRAVAESVANHPIMVEDNREDILLDVENPVIHEKMTTITSHQVKTQQHHELGERPYAPPFDKHSLDTHLDHNIGVDETTTVKEEKPTPKTYSGAARISGCTTCGTDHHPPVPATKTDIIVKEQPSSDLQSTIAAAQKRFDVENQVNGAPQTLLPHNYQSAESLFRHSGGQYSANDLAQYIFWTGDESGVARAVEELIDHEMISREAALLLLKDIRTELDNLQGMYARDDIASRLAVKPPKQSFELGENYKPDAENVQASVSPSLIKVLASLPGMLKLDKDHSSQDDSKNEINTGIDYDETTGRLRLADFLYAEYSLEEVIYQLAKVMFSQSLHEGSEKAQIALQKLTGFLESEGAHGRISPVLQKKVLDVLLVALSDTLNESPELMQAAKQALGDYLHKLPKNSPYSKN